MKIDDCGPYGYRTRLTDSIVAVQMHRLFYIKNSTALNRAVDFILYYYSDISVLVRLSSNSEVIAASFFLLRL